MTKKDYELIAKVFRMYLSAFADEGNRRLISNLAMSMAGALKDNNPRFDLPTFLEACGIEIEARLI